MGILGGITLSTERPRMPNSRSELGFEAGAPLGSGRLDSLHRTCEPGKKAGLTKAGNTKVKVKNSESLRLAI